MYPINSIEPPASYWLQLFRVVFSYCNGFRWFL